MSRLPGILVLLGLILLGTIYYTHDGGTDEQSVVASADRAKATLHDAPQALIPSLASPFGSASYVPPDQAELIKARKLRMLADGYTLPEKYIIMSLPQLTELGKAGDAAAAVQLADRYWNEARSLEAESGMDFSQSPREVAVRYFMLATRGGAGYAPEVMAKRLYEAGGDMVEAAAWDMVAGKFSDTGIQPLGPNRSFARMNYEQMNKANTRAAEIALQIGANW